MKTYRRLGDLPIFSWYLLNHDGVFLARFGVEHPPSPLTLCEGGRL